MDSDDDDDEWDRCSSTKELPNDMKPVNEPMQSGEKIDFEVLQTPVEDEDICNSFRNEANQKMNDAVIHGEQSKSEGIVKLLIVLIISF